MRRKRTALEELLNDYYERNRKMLAVDLGVDRSTISRWLSGSAEPSSTHREAIFTLRQRKKEEKRAALKARLKQKLPRLLKSLPTCESAVNDDIERLLEWLLDLLLDFSLDVLNGDPDGYDGMSKSAARPGIRRIIRLFLPWI